LISQFFSTRFGANGFIGETLWLGHLGQFFILLSFFMSGLSAVAYFLGEWKKEDEKGAWKNLGRIAFTIHGISVLSIFGLLFLMILNHKFEYYYAWRHSSTTLPLKYMVSCFWEGQEGSFLLWQFWHFVLGLIIIKTAKKWENGTMFFLSCAQLVIGSMLLGIYLFGHRIGVNPFMLLRHEMQEAPIFQRPEYLSFIKDGNGLNALLQNYWMVIHPPILFLGFASTTIPYCLAMTALWRRDYAGWVPKTIPWSVFSLSILGTGIIMGGAWAYESLSFGGFWAWDPVENASLVPWLMVVAGLHGLLIYKHTKQSIHLSFIFIILGFLLVLYSTFLTRSGILGESSVHAFTDEGLGWQLVVMVALFVIPALVLYLFRLRDIPSQKKEEEFLSREFWMFIGSLFLLVSAVLITFTTSIPVWNKAIVTPLFKTSLAAPADAVAHYNNSQVWLAAIVAILTAFIQFLGYFRSNFKGIIWLGAALGVSIICSALTIYFQKIDAFQFAILLACAYFTFFANLFYIISSQRKRLMQAGGSLAHIGFALMLLGIVISQYKQRVISSNLERIDYGKGFTEKDKADNRLLIQHLPVMMQEYKGSYEDKQEEAKQTIFNIHFEQLKPDSSVVDKFDLHPYMQVNGMGAQMASNPDTKHYLTKDVFTNVSTYSAEKPKIGQEQFDTINKRDSIFTTTCMIRLDSLVANPPHDSIVYKEGMLALGAGLTVRTADGKTYHGMPIYVIDMKEGVILASYAYNNWEAGVSVSINNIIPEKDKVVLSHMDIKKTDDFVIMRTIVFPYINLLWLGAIIMVAGGLLATLRRILDKDREKAVA
jgi:cytochrome c-type biogenesis protein CcmF